MNFKIYKNNGHFAIKGKDCVILGLYGILVGIIEIISFGRYSSSIHADFICDKMLEGIIKRKELRE